jgi:hypothetical protein
MRGAGRVLVAAVLLLIAGTLNIIYGIGALDDANIFTDDTRYILTNLTTMGWVLIILGVIQLTGAGLRNRHWSLERGLGDRREDRRGARRGEEPRVPCFLADAHSERPG